ncbi:hypothetical protein Tco_0678028 [Tanacetum coccineum]|uniref:Uncharacterized protein n=1 Tax=Tanacetum coccineum TaxID=301880 RepID=A0ABQ4XE31_9ASTR
MIFNLSPFVHPHSSRCHHITAIDPPPPSSSHPAALPATTITAATTPHGVRLDLGLAEKPPYGVFGLMATARRACLFLVFRLGRVWFSRNAARYDEVTPSDTYSVPRLPSGGVTDWYQSQGYREPGLHFLNFFNDPRIIREQRIAFQLGLRRERCGAARGGGMLGGDVLKLHDES